MQKEIYKILLISFIFGIASAFGKEPQVTIVYSGTEASRSSAYALVVAGIEKTLKDTQTLVVGSESDDIQSLLDNTHPDIVIALGKTVAEAVNKTSYRAQTLAGLMYLRSKDTNGVSLALDSRFLIGPVRKLVPSIKRIFIIQQTHYQTIDHVAALSKTSPIVEVREGADSLATIRILGRLLEGEATESDAVFIPANLPNNILYEVAKSAWDKRIILLSTNLSHLDNGALIVAYPDNLALGEQLGRLAYQQTPANESVKGISLGLNRRVAQHLNIDFDQVGLNAFALKIK
jgi:ABC-type uncharacterized transport system substrate-binding protein